MALVLFGVERAVPSGSSDPRLVLRLAAEVVAGAAAYTVMARWLGIEDLQPVLRPAQALLRRAGIRRSTAD